MKTVFVHGLGQNASIWDETVSNMNGQQDIVCPNLFSLVSEELIYDNLYKAFSRYLGEFSESINLCGLSLGAVLSINYTIDFPDRVNSLVLIGAQYKMPKKTIKLQNVVFKLMPKSLFKDMGIEKKDCIGLTNSMADLDFSYKLKEITCATLIICGEKDAANKIAAIELEERIVGAEIKMIDGVGHEVNAKDPERLAEILDGFYRSK